MGSEIQALPGFAEFVERDVDRAGAKDFTGKEYNAVNIRKNYPGTYQAVARALFYYRLPVKTCADLFRMNSQCVSAIRDQIIAESDKSGAAAFLVEQRRRSQRDIVIARLTEAISEKLSDDGVVAELSVADLTSLLERLEKAPAARNGTESRVDDAKRADVTIIDASAYDDAINGLIPSKKFPGESFTMNSSPDPAAMTQNRAAETHAGQPECSTSNLNRDDSSVEVSNIHSISTRNEAECAVFDDVCDSLCDSLCNNGINTAQLKARPSTDLKHPTRGGGEPGVASAGDLTNNASDDTQGGES